AAYRNDDGGPVRSVGYRIIAERGTFAQYEPALARLRSDNFPRCIANIDVHRPPTLSRGAGGGQRFLRLENQARAAEHDDAGSDAPDKTAARRFIGQLQTGFFHSVIHVLDQGPA